MLTPAAQRKLCALLAQAEGDHGPATRGWPDCLQHRAPRIEPCAVGLTSDNGEPVRNNEQARGDEHASNPWSERERDKGGR
jgi:hypothetical protein